MTDRSGQTTDEDPFQYEYDEQHVRTAAAPDAEMRSLTTAISEPLPATLSSSQAKLVYLYLRLVDGETVDALRENLGMKTISLYPVLQRLVDEGLVSRQGDRYVCCRNT